VKSHDSAASEIIFPDIPEPQNIEVRVNSSAAKTKRPKKRISSYVKSYAWRLTASYLWFKILVLFLGWHTDFEHFESGLVNRFVEFLSSIGFAPVNTINLLTVMKVGWILIITGFKPLEILWLLGPYTVTFPIWVPVAIAYRYFSKGETSTSNEEGEEKERFRLLALCTSLLVWWFLLYGGASTQRQIIPGVVFAGIILLILSFRLFLRTKPAGEAKLTLFRWLLEAGPVLLRMQATRLDKVERGEYKKKKDLQVDAKLAHFSRKLLARITQFTRGERARDRISLVVFVEYLVSLIMVAASAVLFWALVMKALAPTQLPFLTCLHLSVSYFLPGIQNPDSNFTLPLWSVIGPAATAWILFVLYIGPAASLLPDKQKATIRGLSKVHETYRRITIIFGKEGRVMKRLAENLPDK